MKTFLDWSAYENAGMGDAYADIPKTGGDFAKAVAVCINSGQCENTDTKGMMCPSFRVTQNSSFSTGGRVRLLKAALNGELGELPFTDPKLAEAMDSCVGCKGCKRECENSVDMAMIKQEFLAQHQALKGTPKRNRLFAFLPIWLSRYRASLRPLIRWRNRSSLLARLGDNWFGINAQRRLPEPTDKPFITASENRQAVTDAEKQQVVLFVDSYSRYFSSQIAQAAQAVLAASGYHVIIPEPTAETAEAHRPLCCGRSLLAHGQIDAAKAEAKRVLEVLLPYAEAGYNIVGLEPSCLLALRDDYKSLGLGEMAETVSKQSILFEEFLVREQMAKRLNLNLQPLSLDAPLLVQGHCHQNAVGAMKAMRKVLKMIPKLNFELIPPSCCGMAGSFGLESEHAEMSKDMAELALLPALREAPEAMILANGFSCREQIHAHDGRQAVHVAELLQSALVPAS